MRKKQLSLICFLFAYIFSFANNGELNLLFDNSCMDKFDYLLTKKDATGVKNINYSNYHIKINDSEKVVLNTAAKGKTVANRPAGTKFCGDLVVSESFARQINSKKTTINLVLKTNDGFLVLPVNSADYFFTTDSEMGYSTKEYTFAYNYVSDSKKDLATKDSKGNVYFKGRDDKFCPSKYTFRRTPAKNYDPYTDFILVPDIGIVQKKTGLDAAQANSNVLELQSVNNIPLTQYMDAVCNGYVNYLSKEAIVKTNTATNNTAHKPSLTDLESGKSTHTNHTNVVYNTSNDICHHLYKDIDKGFYYNKNTGKLANESCGGITYNRGMRVSNTTPINNTDTRVVYSQPVSRPSTETKVVYRDSPPKVVYRDSPPKVVYRDAPEKVVYKEKIVYRDRPQEDFTSRGTTSSTPVNTTSTVVATPEYHTVQAKETLYSISKKYYVGVEEIKRWNNLKGNTISIGQSLRIRGKQLTSKGGSTISSAAPRLGETVPGSRRVVTETIGTSTNSEYHIVQVKETLYSIAKKYNMSVDRLKRINNMKSNTLSIGQRLNLVYIPPTSYNVNPNTGKTLATGNKGTVAIPKEYDAVMAAKEKEIMTSKGVTTTIATNMTTTPVTNTTTIVKNELIGKSSGVVTNSSDPLSTYNPAQKVHIVGDNETLYTIAKWYGTTMEKLRALNNFDKNEVILPKQKIRVQ